MATRKARRKPERDASDFQGEGMPWWMREQMRKQPKEKVVKGPPVPPLIEEAVLMAVAESEMIMAFPTVGYVNQDGTYVVENFQWDNSLHWRTRTWIFDIAAYLLYEMTSLTIEQISQLLGCSSGKVNTGRGYVKELVERRTLNTYQKQVMVELETAMYRAEEIAECAILWHDGVVVASGTDEVKK